MSVAFSLKEYKEVLEFQSQGIRSRSFDFPGRTPAVTAGTNTVYTVLSGNNGINNNDGNDNNMNNMDVNGGENGIILNVRNICFSYPGKADVLKHISFEIRKGERVALIGENGSGKTTLQKVIAGIYPPREGEVLLKGRPLHQLSRDEIKSTIGFIFQNPGRYPVNLDENIDIENANTERIRELARRLHFEYERYADKSRILYPGFFNSSNISGGEWQKVALMRLFYHFDHAEILIFDEPTAALDPVSEVEVFKMFNDLSRDKTIIYSTHRLGITKYVDKIIVMQQGAVIDMGAHDYLLEHCPLYRSLYEAQAQWYKNGELVHSTGLI